MSRGGPCPLADRHPPLPVLSLLVANPMPYGEGALYGDARGGDGPGESRFRRLDRERDRTIRTSGMESLWSQYVASGRAGDGRAPFRVMGNFFAGPGQISTCNSVGRRADLTVVERPGRIVFWQFHGLRAHGLTHRPTCRLYDPARDDVDPEDVCSPPVDDDDDESESDGDDESDEAWSEDELEEELETAASSATFERHLALRTARNDELLIRYCRSLTDACRKAGIDVEFEHRIEYECDYFHRNEIEPGHTDLRRLLEEELGDESLVGFREQEFTESELLSRVLFDEDFGGFCTIRGGFESREDTAAMMHAFLHTHQKSRGVDELGQYAIEVRRQELGLVTATEARKKLERELARRPALTLVRRSYGPDTLTTMSVENLRFLVRERRLTRFRLVHVARYHLRTWHHELVADMLQRRWNLKKTGAGMLAEKTCKLFLNSGFGYQVGRTRVTLFFCLRDSFSRSQMMESIRFNRTSVSLMGNAYRRLLTKPRKARRPRPPEKIVDMQIMGACRGENGKSDLLVSVTTQNKGGQIDNVCQGAAQILCMSRLIFYSHMLYMARVFDPRLSQNCYSRSPSSN